MSVDQISSGQTVWGAPEPAPHGWGLRETVTAVGVAVVIAGLGGAAIYAATGGNSHSMAGPQHTFGPNGPGGAMPGGPGGAMPGGPGGPHQGAIGGPGPASAEMTSLHGEFVVPDTSGFTTVLTQTGAVTAISPTSITVRSADNYSQTYVIPATAGGATAPFAVDDQVTVRATRTGQTATVTNIGDALPGGFGGPVGPPPHPN
jgi:hypothetical protein